MGVEILRIIDQKWKAVEPYFSVISFVGVTYLMSIFNKLKIPLAILLGFAISTFASYIWRRFFKKSSKFAMLDDEDIYRLTGISYSLPDFRFVRAHSDLYGREIKPEVGSHKLLPIYHDINIKFLPKQAKSAVLDFKLFTKKPPQEIDEGKGSICDIFVKDPNNQDIKIEVQKDGGYVRRAEVGLEDCFLWMDSDEKGKKFSFKCCMKTECYLDNDIELRIYVRSFKI